jgi:2-furoyl-CoA dehydrogenase FAD binding subunit
VKVAAFQYQRPGSVEQAVEWLRSDADASVLAGGQSLVPMMAMRLARPRVLVDLGGVLGLDSISVVDRQLVVGAMVRQRVLERRPGVWHEVPLLAAALPCVGHREIRNRGTVGGSLAHADPAAELGLVAAVLQATVVVRGPRGAPREIAGDEFVLGPFQNALSAGELVTEVRWPLAGPDDRFAFVEVARRHGDFALCGVAVHVRAKAVARVGLLGVAGAPLVREVGVFEDNQVARVADDVCRGLDPGSDMHASAGYRRRLARVLVERALRKALAA